MQHLFPTKSKNCNAKMLHQYATVSDSLDRILLTQKFILASSYWTDTRNSKLNSTKCIIQSEVLFQFLGKQNDFTIDNEINNILEFESVTQITNTNVI